MNELFYPFCSIKYRIENILLILFDKCKRTRYSSQLATFFVNIAEDYRNSPLYIMKREEEIFVIMSMATILIIYKFCEWFHPGTGNVLLAESPRYCGSEGATKNSLNIEGGKHGDTNYLSLLFFNVTLLGLATTDIVTPGHPAKSIANTIAEGHTLHPDTICAPIHLCMDSPLKDTTGLAQFLHQRVKPFENYALWML